MRGVAAVRARARVDDDRDHCAHASRRPRAPLTRRRPRSSSPSPPRRPTRRSRGHLCSHLCDLGIPALEHLGDLPRLLLVRDVERRLLAIAPLALLEADDRHLGRPELALGAIQLLKQEHHRRPAALGQHGAIDLLADEDALVLIVVGQLFERLRHVSRLACAQVSRAIAARSSGERSMNSRPMPGNLSFAPPRATRTTRPWVRM